jgi:apolipoprotein N-acyltransferase
MKNGPSSTKNTKDTKSKTREKEQILSSPTTSPACAASLFSSCSSCPSWILAFSASILLWASFPPLDLWPFAWIAPLPWLLLIRRDKLGGRRPYMALALAGFVFWLGVLHFMRLPHWATSFGWVALSFYFAFYLPVFVGLSRVAVHRCRVPAILAAPIVWTGLELARGHLLTGMSMACLGHTQYRWVELIQVSDLAGAYGVSFLLMFVAASLARIIPCAEQTRPNAPPLQWRRSPRRMLSMLWPLLPVAAVLVAVLLYGHHRIATNSSIAGPRIALIQGSIDVELFDDPDPETTERRAKERNDSIFREYLQLSRDAIRDGGHIDLLVWPESMFPGGLLTFDPKVTKPSWYKGSEAKFRKALKESAEAGPETMAALAKHLGVPLLLGSNREHLGVDGEKCYTSAIYVGRDGKIAGCYDKVHLVMFGEYMPFVEYAPWLRHLTPLTGSATPGKGPVALELTDGPSHQTARIAPSICYESVLSHMIRGHVNALAAEGREPDVLVNLTNDGWFWGSSELDLHLMCGVFRAVECRKPFLVAANTGFSASIDSDGRIVQQGPRRAKGVIIAEPRLDRHRRSWYLEHGDWFAGACLAACELFAAVGLYRPLRSRLERKT